MDFFEAKNKIQYLINYYKYFWKFITIKLNFNEFEYSVFEKNSLYKDFIKQKEEKKLSINIWKFILLKVQITNKIKLLKYKMLNKSKKILLTIFFIIFAFKSYKSAQMFCDNLPNINEGKFR